jgi:hypothetical protein
MKRFISFLPPLAAGLLALSLAGCGGSSVTNVNVGGSITGLTETGLILSNGYTALSIDANATTFKFPTRLNEGLGYSVGVVQQPNQMTCTVTNPNGTIGSSDVTNVQVTCAPNKLLSGYVNGLIDSITLVNGKDVVIVPSTGASTHFQFPTRVAEGASYGVTILPGSTSQNCTVVNGVGTMGTADIDTIQVNCQ